MNNIRIGILCYPTYGGSGIVATELGMLLAKKGYQVHFMSSNMPARLDMTLPNVYFHKVNIEVYPLFKYQPYDIALSSTIYHVVKKYNLNILHAHYAIPYAYAAYMAKQMLADEGIEMPLITTLHGTDITLVGKHHNYKKAVEFSINKSDVVTSVSESLKKDTYSNFDIKKNIHVIPNFIDNNIFTKINRCCRSQFANENEKILIHVSNLRKVKRIEDVLRIFKKVEEEIPSRLIIIGEGPEMDLINDFLDENPELLTKIRLMGKVNDLYEILSYADIFLLPSQQESFGLAALEAMAAGVPVISSNAGGIPEVNEHEITGFVTNIGDTDAMIEYTKKMFKNEKILTQMKLNAKKRALMFDISNIIPMYEELYEKALQSN